MILSVCVQSNVAIPSRYQDVSGSRIIPNESKRGGVAVLFKNKIFEDVYNVVPLKDQLWFSVSTEPGIRFGVVYI